MIEILTGPSGAHPWLEIGYWLSQIGLACLAIVGTAYAYRQLRSLQLFELLKFIQTERMMELRRKVRKEIGPIRNTEWWKNGELEACASVVASGYDVLGDYLRSHGPRSLRIFFIKYWCYSIVDTYTILKPYIDMRREQHDHGYLVGYTWLYNVALPYTKNRVKGTVES